MLSNNLPPLCALIATGCPGEYGIDKAGGGALSTESFLQEENRKKMERSSQSTMFILTMSQYFIQKKEKKKAHCLGGPCYLYIGSFK